MPFARHPLTFAPQSAFQGGGKGKKRAADFEARERDWESFKALLATREREGSYWDVIVDGANVGYYQMNFGGAPPHVDYNQIDWVVKHFEGLGLKVLVVMHSRHFKGKMFPKFAEPIVKRWDQSGGLLRTPLGGNDDWYWLHASLFGGLGQQAGGQGGGGEDKDKAKRVEKLPYFVSNDELRDHQFMMLAARELYRWKERRAVKFSFGDWNATKKQRELSVAMPKGYSERVQARPAGGGEVVVPHGEGRTWTIIKARATEVDNKS